MDQPDSRRSLNSSLLLNKDSFRGSTVKSVNFTYVKFTIAFEIIDVFS